MGNHLAIILSNTLKKAFNNLKVLQWQICPLASRPFTSVVSSVCSSIELYLQKHEDRHEKMGNYFHPGWIIRIESESWKGPTAAIWSNPSFMWLWFASRNFKSDRVHCWCFNIPMVSEFILKATWYCTLASVSWFPLQGKGSPLYSLSNLEHERWVNPTRNMVSREP